MGRLREELKQNKPFTPESEVFLNLLRTTDVMVRRESDLLKAAGLTFSQYNVLRILRGAGPDGLKCADVAERMVTRDPDVTRLLDRLESQGLAARQRSAQDRRVVTTRITPAGRELLARLDRPTEALLEQQLGHLSRAQMRTLSDLLELARSGA
jgi:DNA-binding MarR family transcriptional regulator